MLHTRDTNILDLAGEVGKTLAWEEEDVVVVEVVEEEEENVVKRVCVRVCEKGWTKRDPHLSRQHLFIE